MKDLGHLHYFLGLEVHFISHGIFLNQHKYTEDLISMARLQSVVPIDTPLEVNVKYQRDGGDLLADPLLYRQLVVSLNYLTITRPINERAKKLDREALHFFEILSATASTRPINSVPNIRTSASASCRQ